MAKKNTTEKKVEQIKESPKKTTTAKSSPKIKKESTFTAVQAGRVLGVHRRYSLYLSKRYPNDFNTMSMWKAHFVESGILIEE